VALRPRLTPGLPLSIAGATGGSQADDGKGVSGSFDDVAPRAAGEHARAIRGDVSMDTSYQRWGIRGSPTLANLPEPPSGRTLSDWEVSADNTFAARVSSGCVIRLGRPTT
jgi:hypothetical protein